MRKQGVLTLTGWHLANFVLNSHGTANLRQIHSRKNPLNHPMDKRSRRRRVEDKRDTLQIWALEEGISASSLLGYLLYLENWNLDKALSATAWKIFMGEKVRDLPVVTLEESIWLIEKSRMSQATYLEMRLRFKDRIYFHPVQHIRAENQAHRPTLVEYRHGVKAPLLQCLSLTLTERLQLMDLSGLDVSCLNIVFKMGWGLDGSGEHKDYHQLSKVSFSTKQVMSVCFALREVSVSDGGNSVPVVWTSRLAGSNKPSNTRPLALFPAKEDVELLKEFIPIVEAEIKEMEDEGVLVEVTEEGSSSEARASCSKCSMSMVNFFCLSNGHRGKYFCTRSMAK